VRFALYTGLLSALFASLPWVVGPVGAGVFRENGPLEWLQVAVLALAAVLCARAARAQPQRRILLAVLAGGFALCVVREMDSMYQSLMPETSRKTPAYIAGAILLAAMIHLRQRLLPQLLEFVPTRGFALLWVGGMTAGVFAQLVGNGDLLESLLGEHYVRIHKRMIEEAGETFGYLLLLVGVIETVLSRERD